MAGSGKVNEGRWGEALWNQRPRIDTYTQDNINFTEQVRAFAGQVANVEHKYAKELRQVLRSHEKTMSDQNTTVAQAWRQIFVSLDTLALAHENAGTSFTGPVSSALADMSKDATRQRKDILAECAHKDAGLNKELDVLGKERAKFSKLERDADAASQAFLKAESSDTVTKAKVEKARKTWEAKSRIRDDAQKKLQVVLDQVNSKRTQFFHIEMPESIDKLQRMDEDHSEKLVQQIGAIGSGYNAIGATGVGASVAIKTAVDNHDKKEDSKVFAQLHKTTDFLPSELKVHTLDAPVQDTPAQAAVAVPQSLGVEAHAADDDDELPEMSAAAQYAQARILYDYTAEDGSINCVAHEVLGIVENDGSGWVHVMRQDGTQGYVPASFME